MALLNQLEDWIPFVDIGAQKKIIVLGKALAYFSQTMASFRTKNSSLAVELGNHTYRSLGTEEILVLIPAVPNLPCQAIVVNGKIPFLIGLDFLDALKSLSLPTLTT